MKTKSLYAIRSEAFVSKNQYGYIGKAKEGYIFSWYPTTFDAKTYKSKKAAESLAKYYQSIGIKCRVVAITNQYDC